MKLTRASENPGGGRTWGCATTSSATATSTSWSLPDLWERYIDPAYAHAAPRGLSEITRDMRVRVKNHVMLRMGPTRPMRVEGRKTGWQKDHDTVYAASEARGWDAQSQVDAMNAEGLDLAVLFPSRGLFVLGLDSSEQIGADGLEPGIRVGDRPRLQRLAEGLLRLRP